MIAYGSSTSVNTTGTYNAPTISGADVVGFVHVAGSSVSDDVTAVTWVKGGVATAMTKINASVQVPSDRYISSWVITNPDSGGQIVITGGAYKRSFAQYFTGVDQTTPVPENVTATASSSTSISTSLTVSVANSWIVSYVKNNSGGITYTINTGLMRFNADAGGLGGGDSNGTVSTGSNTTTFSSGTSTNHAMISFSLKPAGGATSHIKSADGILLANIKSADGVTN